MSQRESKPSPLKSASDTLPKTFFNERGGLEPAHTLIFKATGAGVFCALCCIFCIPGRLSGFLSPACLLLWGGKAWRTPSTTACRSGREAAAPEATWAARGHRSSISGPVPGFWAEDAIS